MSERERPFVHPDEFVRVPRRKSNKKWWATFRIVMNRRTFLHAMAGSAGLLALNPALAVASPATNFAAGKNFDDEHIRRLVDAHRPSRLKRLPSDFNERVGATHVAGKYYLTSKPFLIEGAEKLLQLGTRLGKFWFVLNSPAGSYPFNSHWEHYETLVDLARSGYFQQLFALPFATLILETSTRDEWPAKHRGSATGSFTDVTQAYFDLTAYLYKILRERPVTVILQHWEGDWLLRGRGGELWNPPPPNWKERCEEMVRWLAARQRGVTKAQVEFGKGAKCRIAHAAEVNRVADLWKGIPTMTEHVLPNVELDLVSYSCYDGMKDGVTLWKCIAEIKRHARTTGLFGEHRVYIGEIGIPENEHPEHLLERWDQLFGAMLAAEVPYIAMWELYCNELNPKIKPPPKVPVKNFNDVRGFWLVRPDGSLSETGKFFTSLWQRK
jgi:hypothetical protein